MPSAEEIHRAHAPGGTAQAKLGLALEVRAGLRGKAVEGARRALRTGGQLLREAGGLVGGEAGGLLNGLAEGMAAVEGALAQGVSLEVTLGGGVPYTGPNPPPAQALELLARAVGVLKGVAPGLRGGMGLAERALTLAETATRRGLGFQVGVALPLFREVALKGSAQAKGRRLELRLGVAGRLQLRREGGG